nr:fe(2+) transport protein 1-like [Ipomoea batatas]
MAFFFAVTTPFGIGLSNTYRENSPHALITVGLLNAASAGLLIYMALVDLLSCRFHGPKVAEKHQVTDVLFGFSVSGCCRDVYFGQVGLT